MCVSKCGCKGCAIVKVPWRITVLSSSEVKSSQIKDLKGNVKEPVAFYAVP